MSENHQAAPAAPDGSFSRDFIERLNSIEERGKKAGLTLTHICRESGVARATPDRWRAEVPLTVRLIDKMESVVVAVEKAQQPS